MALVVCSDRAAQAAHPLGSTEVVDRANGKVVEVKEDMIVDRATGVTVTTMAQDIILTEVAVVADGAVAGLTKTGEEVGEDSGEVLAVDNTRRIASMDRIARAKDSYLYFYQLLFLLLVFSFLERYSTNTHNEQYFALSSLNHAVGSQWQICWRYS
jgi:hypothetical protein